jgi:hypothetical protein
MSKVVWDEERMQRVFGHWWVRDERERRGIEVMSKLRGWGVVRVSM